MKLENYSESLEMYLETIYDLPGEEIHPVEVAQRLGVSKPSVSRAMGILQSDGLITREPYGPILFTPKGRALAEKLKLRQQQITRFLMLTLNIDKETAEKDACRMEHILSPATLQSINKFVAENSQPVATTPGNS